MRRLSDKRIPPKRLTVTGRSLRARWLLAGLSALTVAQADIGPAGSGLTARASNASTAFWSPAGITRLDQPELMIGATLAVTESKFEVDASNRSGGDADNDTTLLAIPSIYYAHPLNDRWRVGASLTVPSGFGNEYGKSWSGRYLAEESELAFVALAGTVGYKLNDRWSIGGGPMMMYTDSETRARINNFSGPDGRIKLEEDGVGFGWQAGLMYEFSDSVRVGMVYRAEIDPDLSGKPKFQNIGPVLDGVLNASGLKDQSIDVKFRVPEIVQLGYYQAFKQDWSFTADALWINMSAFGINHVSVNSDMTSATLSLDGSFKDMYIFTTGLRYQYRSDLAFSVGGAYATSPTSDGRRTIALPLDRVIAVGAGVEWQWKGFELHHNLNYADLGDGDLDQDNGLAGRIKGSFDTNYAVVLDNQIIKRF
jgi:long-chain fatty acid transport protein